MTGARAVPDQGGRDEEGARAWPDPLGDRRTARKSRTRDLVLEALIDLIDAGDPRPTPRAVAERADVAVRTMYNHFRLDELFVAAADRQVSRYGPLITIVPPSGPLGTRITLIIRQRRHLFEAVGPVLRASYARIPTSLELIEVLDRQRALLRLQLARTLGPEIQSHTTSARVVLSTVEALAGWQAWSTLRFACGHSARQAEQFMVFTISQVLGGVNPPRTRGSG